MHSKIFCTYFKLDSAIIKFSRNKFHDFLPDIDISSFFTKPLDKKGIQNTILSLNPLKAIGTNTIPTKILKLLSNNISNKLSELLNLYFFALCFSFDPKI